jgi:hypothetical protein
VNDDDVLHARLVINDASLMTTAGRAEIAVWLQHCADQLIADGHNYAARFSATYRTPFTEPKKKRK